MCTLTVTPIQDGHIVAMNRDEHRSRKPSSGLRKRQGVLERRHLFEELKSKLTLLSNQDRIDAVRSSQRRDKVEASFNQPMTLTRQE